MIELENDKKITQRAGKVNKRDRDAINYFITILTKQFSRTLEKNPGLPTSTKAICINSIKANLELIQRNLK